ncbi:MAG: TolC family protein [Saprospiraceae bacterium]
MKYLVGIINLIVSFSLFSQSDSTRLFTQQEYFQWILAYHPLVRQSNLLTAEAAAELRMARGGFDPKLESQVAQKSFDGKNYYTYTESGFKIPTWYGLEIKGLFNTSSGINIDPEQTLPAAGQAVLGVKATLGAGLFIDERRAALQKARILQNANAAERLNAINEVLLDAAVAYWDWTKAYNEVRAIEQALQVSRQRLVGITESYVQGDRPAVDTLETFIQVQNWEYELNDALLKFRNAGLGLSNFLWYEDNTPLEVTDALRPPLLDTMQTNQPLPLLIDFIQFADLQHPLLRSYQFKINQLDVDRRLALEQLKPRLDVEYNILGDGFNFGRTSGNDSNGLENVLLQNYKWGLNFSFPIFLRKERGKLELTRLKILDTDFTLQQKRLEIRNKVRDAYNEWQNTQQQIALYEDITNNYRRLLEAEVTKFELGESSIFLINSREQKLIEAQVKLIKLQADFQKNRNKLDWAAGRLVTE